MQKKVIIIIMLLAFVMAAYFVVKSVFRTGERNVENTTIRVEKAADETIPTTDRKEMSREERGFGAAHKKKAYDNAIKAHDRTDKYLEDHGVE